VTALRILRSADMLDGSQGRRERVSKGCEFGVPDVPELNPKHVTEFILSKVHLVELGEDMQWYIL